MSTDVGSEAPGVDGTRRLSGAFFSLESVPAFGRVLIELNPVFYVVDGYRYAMIGQAEGNPVLGFVVLILLDVALAGVAWRLLSVGYKLKP